MINKCIKITLLLFSIFFIICSEIGFSAIISKARIIGVPEKFYNLYIQPLENKKKIRVTLKNSSHTGSYKEIGRSIARYILKTDPDYKNKITQLVNSIYDKDHPVRTSNIETIKVITKKFYPEILEEIKGFAEIMKIDQKDAIRIYTQYGVTRFGNCTIFAISKDKTKNKSLLIGRNYDWLPTLCDLHMIQTAPSGSYKSVGSADIISGRLDGINEHGLFIGIAGVQSEDENDKGFFFPIIVRAVLDKAKTVDEAIDVIKKAPHSVGTNFLIADKSGRAAVLEAATNKNFSIRWLKDNPEGFLVATNHFQNNGTKNMHKRIMPNSYERIHIIKRLLKNQKAPIDHRDISKILRNKRPHGVHLNSYAVSLGTLYSNIYDTKTPSCRVAAGETVSEIRLNTNTPNRENIIIYDNEEVFIPDFISTTGYDPVDQNTFFFQYGFYFMATPVLSAALEFTANYKIGLFSTEKTYGPHISVGLYTFISPAFIQGGMKFNFAPHHFFNLEVTPFYMTGWRIYRFRQSDDGNAGRVTDNLNDRESEIHHCPGIVLTPIINIASFLSIENRFTLYGYNKKVYDYRTALLVRRSVIWSPKIQILIPFSPGFLWGITSEANYEFSNKKYNIQIGPMLVFPKLFADTSLVIIPTYWLHVAESGDKFNVTMALRGQF